MTEYLINKKKIINDPVFGFISLQSELVFDLLEHPFLQRLRRIKQLGLSYLVYPGANHTRFEHVLGASHLMRQAISVLKLKGHEITAEEADGATLAILLHDIGHAPFSHVLENTLVDISHEKISALMMEELNRSFDGKLDMAIAIFKNQYKKQFLHQLVASQLDMDRLDYLSRDSFFTGVAEGIVGIDRIIKMLTVRDDQLAVDYKGIYSIEKFLIARRLMYWQVYFHKTVVSAEFLLIQMLKRAKEVLLQGIPIFLTSGLKVFMSNRFTEDDFRRNRIIDGQTVLNWYAMLDDNDIFTSVKEWQSHPDPVLSTLARQLINRKLFRIKLKNKPATPKWRTKILLKITDDITHDESLSPWFLIDGEITNSAYDSHTENIKILLKNGKLQDIGKASDINLTALTKTVRKYFVCYPKELDFK